MKVLIINTNENYGGAARAAWRIMRGVQQMGVEVQMFVKNRGSHAADVRAIYDFIPTNSFFKIYHWFAQKVENKIQYFRWRPYKHTKQVAFMSDLRSTDCHGALQKLDYDIVHLHWINQRFLDIKELKKVHKPIVWTLHDSWPFCGICHLPMDCKQYESHCSACPMLGSSEERDLAYKVFEQKLAVYKDLDLHIVTPSNWLAECAKRSALLGQFPITVIPNCIDTEVYQPMNKREIAAILGLKPDKKYLLFGAMQATKDRNKGFDLLIEALQQIKNIDAELIVYGTDEDLSKYNIQIPVHSVGYLRGDKQMAMLYNSADVMIVPSRSENLSNTIMESMSCGTPVVAFNIGGNSDMIEHMQNGYLAKEKDSDDLARGIQWCLSNNVNNQLGKLARGKVLANFSPEIVCQKYKELYQSKL